MTASTGRPPNPPSIKSLWSEEIHDNMDPVFMLKESFVCHPIPVEKTVKIVTKAASMVWGLSLEKSSKTRTNVKINFQKGF